MKNNTVISPVFEEIFAQLIITTFNSTNVESYFRYVNSGVELIDFLHSHYFPEYGHQLVDNNTEINYPRILANVTTNKIYTLILNEV